MKDNLFTEVSVGSIGTLKNRMVLAPMTRARASEEGVVGEHVVEYYTQRATAGLIISEATNISYQARGWWCAPGIHTDEQVKAWKLVTDSVHRKGGKIVLQLWHTGRSSHSKFHNGELPVSASAIKIDNGTKASVPGGEKMDYEVPRELTTDEIPDLITSYVRAAENALEAGFDGIEIHNANGYLLNQFLESKTNKRTDKYGGSLVNRLRLIDEILEKIKTVIPLSKVGIRFSPNGVFNDMGSEDYVDTYTAAIQLCAEKKVAYIHVMDGLGFGFHELGKPFTIEMTKDIVKKVQKDQVTTLVMGNTGYTKETAESAIRSGNADMIAFGRPWISTPDLVYRFQNNIDLNSDDGTQKHWYRGGYDKPEEGYTTFPFADSGDI